MRHGAVSLKYGSVGFHESSTVLHILRPLAEMCTFQEHKPEAQLLGTKEACREVWPYLRPRAERLKCSDPKKLVRLKGMPNARSNLPRSAEELRQMTSGAGSEHLWPLQDRWRSLLRIFLSRRTRSLQRAQYGRSSTVTRLRQRSSSADRVQHLRTCSSPCLRNWPIG